MYTESNNLEDYLKKSEVIDYDNKLIVEKCLELQKGTDGEISLIKKVYEFAHRGPEPSRRMSFATLMRPTAIVFSAPLVSTSASIVA